MATMTSCLRTRGPLQGGERHVGRVGIGAVDDELIRSRRPASHPPGSSRSAPSVQNAYKPSAFFADAREEFVEIVPAAGILEAFVVHDEALDDEFAKAGIGPATELGATGRFDAEAHGEGGLKIVVGDVVGFAVGGSCPEIPDN